MLLLLEVVQDLLRLLELLLAEEKSKSFQFTVFDVEYFDLVDQLLLFVPGGRGWRGDRGRLRLVLLALGALHQGHKGPGALLVFLEGRLLPVGLGIELSWLLNGDSFLLEFPYFLECSLVVWVVHRLGRDWVLNVAQS